MKPLSDRQVQSFIANGLVILRPTLDDHNVHDRNYLRLKELFQADNDPGNEVLPRAQDLAALLCSPEIVGACTTLLGERYFLHPHRRAHESKPGRCDQYLHQDSYKGRGLFRQPYPIWLMGMYYPQDTSHDMGPTELLPGSQYYAGGDDHRFQAEVKRS